MLDKKALRQKIEEAILHTTEAIKGYRDMSEPVSPDDSIGRISRMDAINNKSVTEATLRQAERKLSKLQAALHMVDREDFGYCDRCKHQIPEQRLMLMPESRYCVRCAQ